MHHGVARDAVVEIVLLGFGRQFAVKQQVTDLQEVAMFGQLVDRIAAMQQDAGVAVDIGNGLFAACGGGEAWIVGEGSRRRVQRADVDDVRPERPASHLEFVRFAAQFQRCSFFGHRKLLKFCMPASRSYVPDIDRRQFN
jgi:hypothetical protein